MINLYLLNITCTLQFQNYTDLLSIMKLLGKSKHTQNTFASVVWLCQHGLLPWVKFATQIN